ncbi:hypothetical protein ACFLYM_02365 [Chloroflexota bacterium]
MISKQKEIHSSDQAGQNEITKTDSENKVLNATKKIRYSHRLFILPLLLTLCTLFYYFGELIDWAAWNALRNTFFYGIHDIHRLLFLVPIIYAGYVGKVKGAIIVTLVTFVIFLPRAFFISPFPDPLLRMMIFTIIAGAIGILTGIISNESAKLRQLESLIRNDKKKLINIIDSMADGVLIIGPDYNIRFMNIVMMNDFGDGVNLPCYKHIYNFDDPCKQCIMRNVIDEKQIMKKEYKLLDKTYDVVSAPYIDIDNVTCQLSIFRKVN